MKALITESIDKIGIKILEQYMQVDCRFGITKEQLEKIINEYDVLIVRSELKYDKELLKLGNRLKVIAMAGIGLDHIDLNYCREKGIGFYNVPDGSLNAVAELAMALILNVLRRVHAAVASVKEQHRWDKTVYIGQELKGKTLGIIAIGKIGSRLARFAQAFDMQVIAFDPYISIEKAKSMDIELTDLDNLFKRADIISIHAPLTKQTFHMISKEQIDKMKDGVYLFNFGRGPIIDEQSLYYALESGKIAGVGVDVMEYEPPGDSKLFKFDNFIVTPHIGAGTIEAQEYISEEISKKVLNHFGFI